MRKIRKKSRSFLRNRTQYANASVLYTLQFYAWTLKPLNIYMCVCSKLHRGLREKNYGHKKRVQVFRARQTLGPISKLTHSLLKATFFFFSSPFPLFYTTFLGVYFEICAYRDLYFFERRTFAIGVDVTRTYLRTNDTRETVSKIDDEKSTRTCGFDFVRIKIVHERDWCSFREIKYGRFSDIQSL